MPNNSWQLDGEKKKIKRRRCSHSGVKIVVKGEGVCPLPSRNSVIEIGKPFVTRPCYIPCVVLRVCISFPFSIGIIPVYLSIILSPGDPRYVCMFANKKMQL